MASNRNLEGIAYFTGRRAALNGGQGRGPDRSGQVEIDGPASEPGARRLAGRCQA